MPLIGAFGNSPASGFGQRAGIKFKAIGGTITTSGPYTIHTFTGNGNFIVEKGKADVEYLIVAGGGGGGGGQSFSSGGGGAGGMRELSLNLTIGTYPVAIGRSEEHTSELQSR